MGGAARAPPALRPVPALWRRSMPALAALRRGGNKAEAHELHHAEERRLLQRQQLRRLRRHHRAGARGGGGRLGARGGARVKGGERGVAGGLFDGAEPLARLSARRVAGGRRPPPLVGRRPA